jgi:hypothetical protein
MAGPPDGLKMSQVAGRLGDAAHVTLAVLFEPGNLKLRTA